jgi:hypothetical protein
MSTVPKDDLLVAFKAFFDGGNEANSQLYRTITLGAFCGNANRWDVFTEDWSVVLDRHHARFLHTTDAVSRQGIYKGWTPTQVDNFVMDCVSAIERPATIREGRQFTLIGIRPVAATVFLKDFKRALQTIPYLGSVEMLCAIHAATACQVWGRLTDHSHVAFFFDRGEHFAGHIRDRLTNKAARRATPALREYILSIGEADSKKVPALQAADLLAWCINDMYDGGIKHPSQKRMLAIDRDSETFKYRRLMHPNKQRLDVFRSWGIPPRKPLR